MAARGKNKRIFLDYASTTPVDPRVEEAMKPYQSARFANPSALYREGVEAKEAVEAARLTVARVLQCKADEIVFTGSGTESDNLAIVGAIRALNIAGQPMSRIGVVTTNIEHPAVLEVCRAIEADGGAVARVPVRGDGIVRAQDVAEAISENTAVVSVMLANNEIGTIQPVVQIGKLIREYRKKNNTKLPYFHVDASQAANYLDVSAARLGADLITLDGSKIYGPKGAGILFVRKGTELAPLMWGGGQERGLRPATENVPAIVGFAAALSIAAETRKSESERLVVLRDRLIDRILENFPEASLNGDRSERLPNNVNICFPRSLTPEHGGGGRAGNDAEFAVIKLDAAGVACSAASSCRALSDETYSYVIEALEKPECASSSLRFTLGRQTREEDIDAALSALVDALR